MRSTSHTPHDRSETVTIRMAGPADAGALRRLAELDSAPAVEPVAMLVADVGGELCAALALDGATVIAHPFRRTAELVTMLGERSRHLQAPVRRSRARSWSPLFAAHPPAARRS